MLEVAVVEVVDVVPKPDAEVDVADPNVEPLDPAAPNTEAVVVVGLAPPNTEDSASNIDLLGAAVVVVDEVDETVVLSVAVDFAPNTEDDPPPNTLDEDVVAVDVLPPKIVEPADVVDVAPPNTEPLVTAATVVPLAVVVAAEDGDPNPKFEEDTSVLGAPNEIELDNPKALGLDAFTEDDETATELSPPDDVLA